MLRFGERLSRVECALAISTSSISEITTSSLFSTSGSCFIAGLLLERELEVVVGLFKALAEESSSESESDSDSDSSDDIST